MWTGQFAPNSRYRRVVLAGIISIEETVCGRFIMNDQSAKPSSLRDRVRQLQRDLILDVASDQFLARGYRATTLSVIADKAGVGVATLFRYFRSKEGVLAALSQRDIQRVLSLARQVAAAPGADPAQAVLAVCTAIFEMHGMPSTQIRGQTRIWLLIPTGHPETDEVVTSSDREAQALILSLLKHYQKSGQIRPRLDLDDMTVVIYAVFYHHYMAVALNPSLKIDDVLAELRRHVPLLFSGWLVEQGASGPKPGSSKPARRGQRKAKRSPAP